MKHASFRSPFEGAPRLNCPGVYGASPRKPIFWKLPCAGQAPIRFSCAGNLPEGLTLDAETGILSGECAAACEAEVTVQARNSLGAAEKKLKLIIQPDGILRTPLMGFTSWNAYGEDVCQADIESAADAISSLGLDRFGYQYVNIDSGWQGHYDKTTRAIAPNAKFPDMPGLIRHIHSLGLKAGIYSTPMQKAWGGEDLPGCTTGRLDPRFSNTYYGIASDHREKENAAQWADWQLDYLKYDWSPCDPENADLMKQALLATNRDFGFCVTVHAGMEHADYWKRNCSSWRCNGDSAANWKNVREGRFFTDDWARHVSPGHFFDLDMLETGAQTSGPARGHLTQDEQFVSFTIRAIFPSPLQISCRLDSLSESDLALLCNEEVLAVNQDALGLGAVCVDERVTHDESRALKTHVKTYVKPLSDGSRAVALFNLGETDAEMGLPFACESARDCWAQENVNAADRFLLAPHSVRLLRVVPAGSAACKE